MKEKNRDDIQQVVKYKEQENKFPAAVLERERERGKEREGGCERGEGGRRRREEKKKKEANSSDTNSGPKKGEEQQQHCPERVENQSWRRRGGV